MQKVRGIVMNRRNVEGEEEKVRAFAESAGLDALRIYQEATISSDVRIRA